MLLVYVLLNTEPSQMENVVKAIKEINDVEEAYMVYGICDICTKVNAKLPKDLKGIVQKIRSQENVSYTLTLIIVEQPEIQGKVKALNY
jgi:DNA-binding Lrp family transcriptional regulator